VVTLREWGETWLDRRKREGLRSIRTLRSLWRCHALEAPFIDRELGSIGRPDVRAFLADRRRRPARQRRLTKGRVYETVEADRPISSTQVRRIAGLLCAIFGAAVEDELVDRNPATRVRLRLPRTEPAWTWLDGSEVALLEGSEELPAEQRAIYLTALYTGARRGELWGLRWSDVHLGRQPHLVVARSYDGPTKSGRVGRVPLIPRAVDVLQAWADHTGRDTELVFARRRRRRLGEMRGRQDTAGWRDYCSRGRRRPGWCTRLGITRRVRFHDLRHSCASHLLLGTWGRRWSLAEVRDMLRHHSVSETERYAHLSERSLFDAALETDG
jgi:integrase